MQLSDIRELVDMKVDDASFGITFTNGLINRAVRIVAAGVKMPGGIVTPPLPSLIKTGAVATTTLSYASLPSDFQRGPVFVSYNSEEIRQTRSHIRMLRIYPSMNHAGSVEIVNVVGKRIYYQGIPTPSQSLSVTYYSEPATLSLDTSEPDSIPEQLQEPLIVHYCAWRMFSMIEDGMEGQKVNTNYHQAKFYEACADLAEFYPEDARPTFIEDGVGFDFEADYL